VSPRWSRIRHLAAAAGATLLAAAWPGASSADRVAAKSDQFIARTVAARKTTGWSSVILRFSRPLDSAGEASLSRLGAYVYRRLPLIDSAAVRVPNRSLQRLAALPFVTRLSTDAQVHKTDQYTRERSGAAAAQEQLGLTGAGVTVAVLDSGIEQAADFGNSAGGSRILQHVGLVNGTSTKDQVGHGTHVAGIIAGNGAASTGNGYTRSFVGIAPKSNLVDVRVLDKDGVGNVSSVIAGVQWVLENKDRLGIRVLNISMGHPVGESYKTDPLCQAVEAAWKSGIVVVCAAGNDGRKNAATTAGLDNEGYGTQYGSILSPGNSPCVITVGATKALSMDRASDQIATYSARGPSAFDAVVKPDIVAPGNRVISTVAKNGRLVKEFGSTNSVPESYYVQGGSAKGSKDYFVLSGTSMAAPVVSGAVALLLEQDPTLTPDTVKVRLMLTADKWRNANGLYDPLAYGAGYLNVRAALNSTAVAQRYALTPRLVRSGDGSVWIMESGPANNENGFAGNALWGVNLSNGGAETTGNALWGVNAIWGGNQVWDGNAIWGTNAVWGENTLWDGNAIWGNNAVWGENRFWDGNALWGVNSTFGADLSGNALWGE
jgi:serine protease AprX